MLQALGRLHPLLVHFPIALLLAALLAEVRRPRAEGSSAAGPSAAGFYCLVLGTLGAFAAVGTGWIFAAFEPPGMAETLARHRWAGLASAVAAGATLVSAWRWKRGAALAQPTRAGLVLAAVLVALTGALGGEMVYGEGFVLAPLHRSAPRSQAEPAIASVSAPPLGPSALPASEPSTPDGSAAAPLASSDFGPAIATLFERRCFECHGERKRPKGNLKLADLGAVLARDADTAVIVRGDPAASELYRRLTLPADDEDRMPPEGAPLAPAELELVRRWIAAGAPWGAPAVSVIESESPEVELPESRGLVLTAAQRAARDEACVRLRARGVRAQRVAATSDEVEVDFGVALPICGDDELALLAGLEPCLVELSLAHSAVGDAGLVRLAEFHALRRLRLAETDVGDAGLRALGPLPALESLDLFGTRVSDASLAALRALPRLARLYTGDTALGDATLDELQHARPGLVLERGHLPAPAAAPEAR